MVLRGVAAVAVRFACLYGRGRHALAAAVGHGCARAWRLCGLERERVMGRLDLGRLSAFLALWFVAIGGPSTIRGHPRYVRGGAPPDTSAHLPR